MKNFAILAAPLALIDPAEAQTIDKIKSPISGTITNVVY